MLNVWVQVYHELYLPNPQGFRLTREEREWLQNRNEQFAKPLPGEIEIMDKLDFNAPVEQWKWKKVSEVAEAIGGRAANCAQIGRVLMKLTREDEHVKVKSKGNVKSYFLPPLCRCKGYYHCAEDFSEVLSTDSKTA